MIEGECKDCQVLKERIDQLETRILDRFSHEKEFREKLAETMERRLEGMNQFQHRMDRLEATFVTWPALIGGMFAAAGLAVAIMEVMKK